MNVIINNAAAQHLDNTSKDYARDVAKKTTQAYEDIVKCNCSAYQSPYKDCPNCGPEYWETLIKQKQYKFQINVVDPDTNMIVTQQMLSKDLLDDLERMGNINSVEEITRTLVNKIKSYETVLQAYKELQQTSKHEY